MWLRKLFNLLKSLMRSYHLCLTRKRHYSQEPLPYGLMGTWLMMIKIARNLLEANQAILRRVFSRLIIFLKIVIQQRLCRMRKWSRALLWLTGREKSLFCIHQPKVFLTVGMITLATLELMIIRFRLFVNIWVVVLAIRMVAITSI